VLLSKDELEFGFLTNQLTGPLTLLDCLDRFQPALASRESLVIHLVGATVFEMIAMIKWECKLPCKPKKRICFECGESNV
jgi:hypothetical protein